MLYIFLKQYAITAPIAGMLYPGLIPLMYGENQVPVAVSIIGLLLALLVPYLLGSFNTAVFISSKFYHDDIRNHGSGNAGFTNIMRVYGAKAAVITFAGDLLKTVLAILVGWFTFGYVMAYISGLACFFGHIFPVFYRFKGGKGVVCAATIMFMLDWRIFLIELGLFIGILLLSKYISLSSVLCGMTYPIFLNRMNMTTVHIIELVAIIIAITVVVKHRANLVRIYNGTENKFKFKKSKPIDEDTKNA
ncbi:MAG: glycerol-3-phosphate 1-O-acyltransferase PlsY [Ruminococcaceae bacterium]|nr:glycerol-3-phosphate 1-O-acyltransferase PlsY [Oscillospiraceae bacterium]